MSYESKTDLVVDDDDGDDEQWAKRMITVYPNKYNVLFLFWQTGGGVRKHCFHR